MKAGAVAADRLRRREPTAWKQFIAWGAFALILAVAPLIFDSGTSRSVLSQIGTVMIFGLSYNMLLGQGGMLSFGHAVYSGLGAFFAVHAMNLAGAGAIWMPLPLIPLVGALAGMFFGVVFGYVTTRKSGITFAMITLGIVELVFASSLMFPQFFGGEGGVMANRVYGTPLLGWNFGPQIQVYYLIAAWLFVATIGMYAFTRTPLGRILNAVRDNPQRAEFIGYDTQWVRFLTLILSGFFAGISGALMAINFEIAGAENVSLHRSGEILLFTFIGGVGYFIGPMIGAVVGVFLTVVLSSYTKAWLLYLGIFFIAIVVHAPGGLASIGVLILRLLRSRPPGGVWRALAAACVGVLIAGLGATMAIEMLYHYTLEAANTTVMTLFGVQLDTAVVYPWLVAGAIFAAGGAIFRVARERLARRWADVDVRSDAVPGTSE